VRRFAVPLGGGAAHFDMLRFGGSISCRRPGCIPLTVQQKLYSPVSVNNRSFTGPVVIRDTRYLTPFQVM